MDRRGFIVAAAPTGLTAAATGIPGVTDQTEWDHFGVYFDEKKSVEEEALRLIKIARDSGITRFAAPLPIPVEIISLLGATVFGSSEVITVADGVRVRHTRWRHDADTAPPGRLSSGEKNRLDVSGCKW